MKKFKFGNPPMYVNRTLIRKNTEGKSSAEKSFPVSKNQIQAKTTTPNREKTNKEQLKIKQNTISKKQKLLNPKFSLQKEILNPGTNAIKSTKSDALLNKPQVLKSPTELIRENLGVIDPPILPISSKIIKANISPKVVIKNDIKEYQNFKTKLQKQIDKEDLSLQRSNKMLSEERSRQNQKNFNATIEERPKRITSQTNDAMITLNGHGGWRL